MGRKLSTEEFLVRAKEIHGSRYDYSFVEYKITHTAVLIVCRKPGHGKFMCSPANHLKRTTPRGCP